MTGWKKLVLVGVLAWASLWPLVHRVLVARYELNPWKFGGWAMYAAAKPPVVVATFRQTADGLVVLDERTFSADARAVLDEFRVRRHALGRLEVPDEVAAAILRERRELERLVVMVQTFHLDRGTAKMGATMDRYSYP